MRHRLIIVAVAAASLALLAAFGAPAREAGNAATPLPGLRGTVWVVDKILNSVAAFDPATGSVRAVVPVGTDPNSVVVAPGTSKAYITNEVSNDVSVVSTMTFEVLATIPVPSRPHHIRTSRDGKYVYVSQYATNGFAIIDTASDRVVRQVKAVDNATALTHSLWISRDGGTIWAANEVANQVTEIEGTTGEIRWALPVGQRPSEVLVTPDQSTAYVTVRVGENKVKRIDVASRSVTADVTLPAQPDTIQLTPDRKRLIVALRGAPAQLSVIDAATMTLVKTINLPGKIAGHNWISANGRYSFVSFEGGNAPGVAVVDHRSNAVVSTWEYPGGKRPHGIFYDDPAATEGPAVAISTAVARVSVRRRFSLRIACSKEAVGFCRGQLLVLGSRTPFALGVGRAASVRATVPRGLVSRLVATKKLVVRVQAAAVDQLGNTRTSAHAVTLVPARP